MLTLLLSFIVTYSLQSSQFISTSAFSFVKWGYQPTSGFLQGLMNYFVYHVLQMEI